MASVPPLKKRKRDAKSGAAHQREAEAFAAFYRIKDKIESDGMEQNIVLLDPNCHLTIPSWRNFHDNIKRFPGWKVVRRAASDDDKILFNVKRKDKTYWIDIQYDPSHAQSSSSSTATTTTTTTIADATDTILNVDQSPTIKKRNKLPKGEEMKCFIDRDVTTKPIGLEIKTSELNSNLVVVSHVAEHSPAYHAGILVGDILINMDGKPISPIPDIHYARGFLLALQQSFDVTLLRSNQTDQKAMIQEDAKVLKKETHSFVS